MKPGRWGRFFGSLWGGSTSWKVGGRRGRCSQNVGVFEKENPTQAWCEILGITAGQVDQTEQQWTLFHKWCSCRPSVIYKYVTLFWSIIITLVLLLHNSLWVRSKSFLFILNCCNIHIAAIFFGIKVKFVKKVLLILQRFLHPSWIFNICWYRPKLLSCDNFKQMLLSENENCFTRFANIDTCIYEFFPISCSLFPIYYVCHINHLSQNCKKKCHNGQPKVTLHVLHVFQK